MLEIQDLKLTQGNFKLSISVPSMSSKIYAVMGSSGAGNPLYLPHLQGFYLYLLALYAGKAKISRL